MLEEKLKKAFMATLGGVAVTGDKLDELKNKLMKENEMTEKEAKGFLDELVEAGEGRWKEFEKATREMVRKRLDSMDVPDRKELKELKARIESLEQRISALENPPEGEGSPGPA